MTTKGITFKKNAVAWERVDWSLPTDLIARDLNCSQSLVKAKRKQLGIPAPVKKTIALMGVPVTNSDLALISGLSQLVVASRMLRHNRADGEIDPRVLNKVFAKLYARGGWKVTVRRKRRESAA